MSWPQAEPLLWPQRHTGQAPLCPLKPLETRAIPGDLSSFDSRPPPGWETDPSLEEKSAPRGPCGGAPSRTEVQPAVKWEEGPCSLSSSSLDPQGRAFPGKGSKKQGPFHGCGSCRGRGGGSRHRALWEVWGGVSSSPGSHHPGGFYYAHCCPPGQGLLVPTSRKPAWPD